MVCFSNDFITCIILFMETSTSSPFLFEENIKHSMSRQKNTYVIYKMKAKQSRLYLTAMKNWPLLVVRMLTNMKTLFWYEWIKHSKQIWITGTVLKDHAKWPREVYWFLTIAFSFFNTSDQVYIHVRLLTLYTQSPVFKEKKHALCLNTILTFFPLLKLPLPVTQLLFQLRVTPFFI